VDALGARGILRIATRQEGDRVQAAVMDTGKGMSEEVRRRVFEPFFSTKGARGTGLGLAIAYGIVARHGGDIAVDSVEGVGSTFTIRLPVGLASPVVPAVSFPTSVPVLRVLVVDDDMAVCQALADMLRIQHHEVAVAEDGAEALERFHSGTFDVVMTDLVMRGMSGWGVARAVKVSRPEVRVVLVTGTAVDVPPDELQAWGIDAIVAKPVGFEELETVMARIYLSGLHAGSQ
jgi:CheY-like chemotaxis protein